MKNLKRTYILIITVVLAIITIVGAIGLSPVTLFTETLRVGDVEDEGDGSYHIRLYDATGRDIVHLTFISGILPLSGYNLTSVRVSIWHAEATHIDALRFAFEPTILHHPLQVYLETPAGGTWNPIVTESTSEHQVFQFSDLGVYGTGTVTLTFLLQFPPTLPSTRITTSLTLHDATSPLVFTQQQATTTLTVPYDG